MTDICASDRFKCVIVNVIDNLSWKGVVVEEVESGGRVYFGKTKPEGFDYVPGDILYIGINPLPPEIGDFTMEVSLYDAQDNRLDWTFV
ncbi:hypothetical protein V7O66_06800 [Methanolobus sp. ZRKC3]|uniref:hypothetical protein n=1 Tax=Methanolobus sp. ZRKC3 TaxID=3125786 RepID=UPI00324D694C